MANEQTTEIIPTAPKFLAFDQVIEISTEDMYQIVFTPNECIIEASRKPSYEYKRSDDAYNKDRRVFIRPQDEMEDGRFVTPKQWVSSKLKPEVLSKANFLMRNTCSAHHRVKTPILHSSV